MPLISATKHSRVRSVAAMTAAFCICSFSAIPAWGQQEQDGGAADRAAAAGAGMPRYHPLGGSGIIGSPDLQAWTARWQVLSRSPAKERARQRFRRNKYGMFIHWGAFSNFGGVWKGKTIQDGGDGPPFGEFLMQRWRISRAEYATAASHFNPERFDADAWVALAKAAGMRYVVLTAKHMDGFAMYKSAVSRFNIVDATPFRRDVVGELSRACARAGLAFGVYYSQSLDLVDGGDAGLQDYGPIPGPGVKPHYVAKWVNTWDPSPESYDGYTLGKALPQVRELVQRYKVSELWLDVPGYIPPKYSFAFYEEAYRANPSILVTQRVGNGFGDIGIPGDNVVPEGILAQTWEGIATTNHSWGYVANDHSWKSPTEILYWLLANTSRGGNFLLNVGPNGAGDIPAEAESLLRSVGRWLAVNGDAIYGTSHWRVAQEGPTRIRLEGSAARRRTTPDFTFTPQDFWFTAKGGKIYVSALVRPAPGESVLITSLAGVKVAAVRLLGEHRPVRWTATSGGLRVALPPMATPGPGYALEVRPAN